MSLVYRPARADDAAPATAIFAAAVNDLSARHGLAAPPLRPLPPNPFFAFCLRDQPEGFWVAEDGGDVIGFALSRVLGEMWFLAFLFVAPGHQGRGIGRELLSRAAAHGGPAITNRALITFAYNPSSISLYLKHGMYPRESIYWMAGPSHGAPPARPARAAVDYERLPADQAALAVLAPIDRAVLGFARDGVHAYLLNAPGAACYLCLRDGCPIGYAYAWTNGRVGPLAAIDGSLVRAVMDGALSLAAGGGSRQISTVVPGANADAVSLALERGLRLTFPYVLMSEKPFGHWDRYLCHSPGLM